MRFSEVVCAVRDEGDGEVVEAAAAFGEALRSTTRLVHVAAPTPSPALATDGLSAPLLPMTAGGVADAAVAVRPAPDLDAMAAACGRPHLVTDVLEGTAVDVLRTVGSSARTGWLVVGDAGRGAFGSLLRGSVARRLLNVDGCPLVVVPRAGRRVPLTGTEPVACLLGGDRAPVLNAPLAGRLAAALGTRVVLVHARAARTDDDELRRSFASARAAIGPGVEIEEIAVPGSNFEAVAATCRAVGARILVVDAASRGAVAATIVPTVTHELVADAEQLVVVARDVS